MRLLPLLACLVALGISVAGCGGGGSDSAAETIPAAPALTVPGNESAPPITDTGATGATGATTVPSTGTPSSSGDTPSSSGGTPSSGQGTGQQQSSSPSGGAEAPSSGTGTPTTPSNGGTPPRQFDKFCKENPGAC